MDHLWILLFLSIITGINANYGTGPEQFDELLLIKSLPRGQIVTHFEFRTFVPTNLSYPFGVNAGKHNDIFPLSLLRLFHQLEIQELHLSLTKGFWKYQRWGLPPRATAPNAHLWAWFSTYLDSKENWKKLTGILSGQFCASINLIDPTVTIRPRLSHQPFLKLKSSLDDGYDYGYLAALPQEPICTENLTPFTKMLPCQRRKGIASLLHATKVFDSQFFSMSVDFQFSCHDLARCQETTGIELKQNILIVFNAPLILDGKHTWSFNSLFGAPLDSHCPLSEHSRVLVDVTPLSTNKTNGAQLTVAADRMIRVEDSHGMVSMTNSEDISNMENDSERVYAEYDLKRIFAKTSSKKYINIGIQYPNSYDGMLPYRVEYDQVQVRRYSRGVGVSTGGITILLTNKLPVSVEAIYQDAIPWYLRMYLHTMRIEARSLENEEDDDFQKKRQRLKPERLVYEPARDRIRPHQLEMSVRLPPKSLTEITFDFDHQFLRWTEFPPDPNHGLSINPASVTFIFDLEEKTTSTSERFLPQIFRWENENSNDTRTTINMIPYERNWPLRLYTEPLWILMPTPDFSMPYNVICLVSTALSIAFGPIYNLTTRRTKIIRKRTSGDKAAATEEKSPSSSSQKS